MYHGPGRALQAAGEKVVAERPGTHKQVTEFMALEGRSLKKIPDLVLCNFDGPRSFTVIDVKVCDPAAPTYRTLTVPVVVTVRFSVTLS